MGFFGGKKSTNPTLLNGVTDGKVQKDGEGKAGSNQDSSSPTETVALPAIGAHVLVNVQAGLKAGIVKFVGDTRFQPGTWVGIELEAPVGKNDGSVQGVKYFECAPQHGVFMSPGMIQSCSRQVSSPPEMPSAEKVKVEGTNLVKVDLTPYSVGSEIEAFSMSQKKWVRAKVQQLDDAIVTVQYQVPGGVTAKNMLVGHEHIRLLEVPVGCSVGNEVEVFSISQQKWLRVKIENVEGGVLTVGYDGPDGHATKQVPANHEHVRLGSEGEIPSPGNPEEESAAVAESETPSLGHPTEESAGLSPRIPNPVVSNGLEMAPFSELKIENKTAWFPACYECGPCKAEGDIRTDFDDENEDGK